MRHLPQILPVIALLGFAPGCSSPNATPAPRDPADVGGRGDVASSDDSAAPDDARSSVADVALAPDGSPDGWMDVGPAPDAGGGLFAKTTVLSGRLLLETNLRGDVDDCDATLAPCDDVDQDGLVDAWEDLILDRFRPMLVFDEQESFLTDPDAVALHVGRVVPVRRRPLVVNAYLTILYDRDYGTCGALSAHDGDSERVVLRLSETADGVRMDAAYTAAHENTPTDHSMHFVGDELAGLLIDTRAPDAARWVVYPSRDKHGTYPTNTICEGISPLPCFSEACGPDLDVSADYARLLDVYNAGEPTAPRLTDLTPLGLAGEDVWADQDFCGGHRPTGGCPGSILGKLTNDPFD